MEAAKFTPGPWELTRPVQEEHGTYRQVTEPGYGGDIIARVCVAHEANASLNECGAGNASLIVAAPDLLDAAELVADTASQEWQDSTGKRMAATDNQGRRFWFITEEIMQVVRDAVAKASS